MSRVCVFLADGFEEIEGLTVVDHFFSPKEGLFLAEVEFPTKEEALAFLPPRWFGEDVTESLLYHNSHLSKL